MNLHELEVMLQSGKTVQAITIHDAIITARHLNDAHYTIRFRTNRGIKAPIREYKTARRAVRKMLEYAPAEQWRILE